LNLDADASFFILLSLPASANYKDLLKRDKMSLDLFWLKDKSLTDTDSLPAPDILATEIADDLEAALEQFTKIAAKLTKKKA
jgi:type I restriction enzyme M protein